MVQSGQSIPLLHAEPDTNPAIHALIGVREANDLYVSEVKSAFEAAVVHEAS